MRILVCGGRHYGELPAERSRVWRQMALRNPTVIIQGGSTGADDAAVQWARRNGVPYITCPALWETQGSSAGPRRNQIMLDVCKPDVVLAFPGGKGTADMVNKAMVAGVKVEKVDWE